LATSIAIMIKSSEADPSRFAPGSSCDQEGMRGLVNLLEACQNGASHASVDVQYSTSAPVAASGTLTLVSAVATDAITIGTTTFTATSTPSLATDWEIDGASDALDAASLAAAINAHATVSQVVTASAADNVVTITAKQKGVVGNFIPLSSADATITASAAFLAGGTGGAASAAVSYSMGL
jgi:phage tail sheath gpL-like